MRWLKNLVATLVAVVALPAASLFVVPAHANSTLVSSYILGTASCSNFGSTVLQFGQDNKADGVAGGHTLTANGNAQWDTAQAPTGLASSALFDGNDSVGLDGSSDFAFGTGDFTVEAWVRFAATGVQYLFLDFRPSSTEGLYPVLYTKTDNKIYYHADSADRITSTNTYSANTWYHVALTRSGTDTKLFVNGTQEGSTYTDSNNYTVGASRPLIGNNGNNPAAGNGLNGWMAGVRVLKGTALYTGTFTAPTLPYTRGTAATGWANTVLVALQENGADATTTFKDYSLYDQSTRDFVITANGNAQYDTASAPTGLTSSLLYDGTGDYHSIADSADLELGSGDFTIEFWARSTNLTPQNVLLSKRASDITNSGFAFFKPSGAGRIDWYASSDGSTWDIASAKQIGTLVVNTWHHVALVRSGNSWTPYLDGVAGAGTVTSSAAIVDNASAVTVGGDNNGNSFTGQIAGLRITKGVARYTSNFTAPSLPYCTG